MKTENITIVVTGAAGYIGSVLVRTLLARGYSVRAFDNLLHGGHSLLGVYNHPRFEFFKGDITVNQDVAAALKDAHAVIHLAAIVGDPACSGNRDLAELTNFTGSRNLIDVANDSATIERFVFVSTCSNYGKMVTDGFVSEDSPLNPVSWYAELKVRFEQYLLDLQCRTGFTPTILRFATAYGLSPRMRFDLTVNEFTAELAKARTLEVFGKQFWRPYCHVDDLAAACAMMLTADAEKINKNVFGVGDTDENYRKEMIVDQILKQIPDGRVRYVHKDEDPRDYRVDFSRISETLGFNVTKKVPDGIAEIYSAIQKGIIDDPFDGRYSNI